MGYGQCPSSKHLRKLRLFSNGGFGSSWEERRGRFGTGRGRKGEIAPQGCFDRRQGDRGLGRRRLGEPCQCGSHILGAAPDFDPGTYGCPNLGTLVTKSGGSELRKEPGKPAFVRRKAAARDQASA